MKNNTKLYGELKVKDLKEFLRDIDDDYVIEVLEDYHINPTSFIRVDTKQKKLLIGQGF